MSVNLHIPNLKLREQICIVSSWHFYHCILVPHVSKSLSSLIKNFRKAVQYVKNRFLNSDGWDQNCLTWNLCILPKRQSKNQKENSVLINATIDVKLECITEILFEAQADEFKDLAIRSFFPDKNCHIFDNLFHQE